LLALVLVSALVSVLVLELLVAALFVPAFLPAFVNTPRMVLPRVLIGLDVGVGVRVWIGGTDGVVPTAGLLRDGERLLESRTRGASS
jgi:hypothetical protein